MDFIGEAESYCNIPSTEDVRVLSLVIDTFTDFFIERILIFWFFQQIDT